MKKKIDRFAGLDTKPKLPLLNSEQFEEKAMAKIPLKNRVECEHVTAARAIPDDNFAGYMIKVVEPKKNPRVMKVCETHAKQLESVTVARVPYYMVGHL